MADCQALADFWLSVAQMGSDQARATAVSDLFLTGTTVATAAGNVFLPPVVTVANYQSPMGQIRTNQFVESPWELRGVSIRMPPSGSYCRAGHHQNTAGLPTLR